jgi:hypothetical protein
MGHSKEVAFDGEMESVYQAYKNRPPLNVTAAEVILGDPIYARLTRMPKWNGPVTMLQEPMVAIRYARSWEIPTSKMDHRQRAELFKQLNGEYAKTYDELVRYACDAYGDHGPNVSGIVHGHFPTNVKDRLRFLSRAVNMTSDAHRLHELLSKTKSPNFT